MAALIETGAVIDHFRLDKFLGEGGMGTVFLAEDLTLSRKVAIKFMSRELLVCRVKRDRREEIESRFIREARSAGAINHPNVTHIHEARFEGDDWYIVMEYIEGTDLGSRIEKGEIITIEEAADIGTSICQGLDYAWQKHKIIHRDIKPGNIMLTVDGAVKIVDLGLAKPLIEGADEASDVTNTGTSVGSPRYMAPEQASAQTVDYRADIYSLGATLYELVTGKKAFPEKTNTLIFVSQLQQNYRPVRELRPAVPRDLEALIDEMLNPDPDTRINDYQAIIQRLEVYRPLATGTRPTASMVPPLVHRRSMYLLALFALILVAGVGAFVVSNRNRELPVMTAPEANDELVQAGNVTFRYVESLGLWLKSINNRDFNEYRPSHRVFAHGDSELGGAEQPVVEVSTGDARGFAAWLGKRCEALPKGTALRLPTREELRSMVQLPKLKLPDIWFLSDDGYVVSKNTDHWIPGNARYCNVGLVLVVGQPRVEGTTPKLDINSATSNDLMALPGLGPSLAKRIVTYRNQNGLYRSTTGLVNVRGIGPKTVARFHNSICARGAVPLNTCTAEELASLPGATEELAKAILAYRENGPFASIDQLTTVGVGEEMVKAWRNRVYVATDADRVFTPPLSLK